MKNYSKWILKNILLAMLSYFSEKLLFSISSIISDFSFEDAPNAEIYLDYSIQLSWAFLL